MNRNCIKFIYDKTTRKRRRLESNGFVLYSPEKIKLQPGEIKSINVKVKFRLKLEFRLTIIINQQYHFILQWMELLLVKISQ